ncbi:MAG: methyltransferase, TIGR04325 family [Planctomycetaceae bacterium]|nr:methyltransferase, TIGR04325 family [Planctomycetaceae bacterium]
MNSWRDQMKAWIPPALLRWRRRRNPNLIRFTGNYADFATAKAASSGYDAELIQSRVIDAQRQVRAGKGLFAQDGVVIESAPPPLRLLAVLYQIAFEKGNHSVSVLDFGGALGSTYDRCRAVAPPQLHFEWNVVEQPALVEAGQNEFSTDELHFHRSIDERLQTGPVDLLLLSGVLPYLEEPFTLFQQIVETKIPWIVIDRTPLLFEGKNRLTVQQVPASIYGTPKSYPAWFLDHDQLCDFL